MISTSVRIAAPPEVVFPYFTDPQLMVTWIGERADLDARPGGTFAVDFGGAAARGSLRGGGAAPPGGLHLGDPRGRHAAAREQHGGGGVRRRRRRHDR